jgi:hypothetical protein
MPAEFRVIGGSSTEQQAVWELLAGYSFANEHRVRLLLERRSSEGQERERRRRVREMRWAGIADGSIEPFGVVQVNAMWSDASDSHVPSRASNGRGGRRGSAAPRPMGWTDFWTL